MSELPPERRELILGAQCNIWTERMRTGREIEYMMFPRAFALSDNMCLGKNKCWEKTLARRQAIRDLCWKLNIVCSPADWESRPEGKDKVPVV